MSKRLSLYHQLPPFARNIAATARGHYLKWWRYGPETDCLVEEALEREQWSVEQWNKWQEEQLAYVLHRAAIQVPYYRQQWEKRRQAGDRSSWQYLENWPILEKEVLRANPRAFVADDCDIRRMFHLHTSGTTGKPLSLWWSRKTVRQWYALFEARWRQWYGLTRRDRWAILGGQLVTPVEQMVPPFWVWNRAFNQLYMSSYHLSLELIPHYLEALKQYQIRYIYAYTSSVYTLAQAILRLNRRDIQMAVIVTNAEPLFEHQRDVIGEAFQCSVRETYGQTEIVAAASECQHGNLHQWPEAGYWEIDPASSSNHTGELLATGLLNADMPLVRYRVGDRISLQATSSPCRCGRKLPLLNSIEGRNDDILIAPDGRKIGRLDPILKTALEVQEVQIVQEQCDFVRIKCVPAPGYTKKTGEAIATALKQRMGNIKVEIEIVDYIPRTPNGKFRAVICKVPTQEY